MKQLGQDEAMDSREMSTLMLILADSLQNKYNLLDKFAVVNLFYPESLLHYC